MGHIIASVLACVVGFFTWGLTTALSNGAYPLGAAGKLDALLFYAPIVGVAVPVALRAFSEGAVAIGLWILALAPLLGGLNCLMFIVFLAKPGVGAFGSWQAIAILTALWQGPLVVSILSVLSREARPSERSSGSETLKDDSGWVPASSSSGLAGPCVKVIRDRGYDIRSRGSLEWRIIALGSRVVQYVRSIEELKAVASQLAPNEEA